MVTPEQVISDWIDAFILAHGKKPPYMPYYAHGWFSLNGNKYRRRDMMQMQDNLKAMALNNSIVK